MAPIVMHAVIGERVYPEIAPLAASHSLGAFLLGCMLADVNGFSDLDRRQTHFVGRPDEDGEDKHIPLMTLAVGTITADSAQFADIREITEVAAAERRKYVEE